MFTIARLRRGLSWLIDLQLPENYVCKIHFKNRIFSRSTHCVVILVLQIFYFKWDILVCSLTQLFITSICSLTASKEVLEFTWRIYAWHEKYNEYFRIFIICKKSHTVINTTMKKNFMTSSRSLFHWLNWIVRIRDIFHHFLSSSPPSIHENITS